MSNFGNGLTTSRDVFRNGDEDSNIWAKKYPDDTIIASHIICDDIDINGGLLTTSAGGTVLELNGVPLGGGIATITGTAPINVTAGQNPIISLNNSGVVAGTYPLADVTVNNKGLITNINAGTIPPNDDWSNFPAQTAVNMNNFKITTLATPTVATDGATKGYVDGAITTAGAGFVNLLTNQTVGGIKTFTSIPVCATLPTANDQLANKQYVDNAVGADALANVLIAGNSAGANQINMNNNKIINCTNPTDPQDVATKNYVDTQAGAGVYLPLAGGTMTNSSANINMNGADITGCGSITCSGVTESAEFGTAITPMFGHNVYATNVSMNSYNPLSAMNFIGVGGVNINAPDEDINLNAGDINLTQTDVTSFMNLTATGSIVLGAGLGIDLTGGTTIQINSAGNVSIGSGNVLGADTEIEKIAFKDNEIYKVAGNADITIEDVASITNTGTAPNGAMLIQAEQNLTLNSTSGNVIVEGLTVNGSNISSTNLVDISAPDISLTATTGTIVINSQLANVEVENVTFTLTGAPATGTTISTANSGRNIIINTQTTGDFNVLTGGNARIEVDGATNGNTTITAFGTGLIQMNQAGSAGGVNNPILKLQNTNAGAGGTTVEVYKAKNVAQNETIAEHLFFANDAGAQKTQFGAIKCVATNVASGNEDGSVDIWSCVNGTQQQVFRFNGADNENNSFRPLDMVANALYSSTTPFNVQNVNSIALGSLTNVGLLGYNITSRGTGQNNIWQQPRQSLLANYGGGSSIDDTTPTNFGVSLPTISFPLSATGRYKVSVSIGFELQSSADLLIYPEVQYNAGTYAGAIYAPPLYVVAPHVNKGGVIHNSASFVDYFTVPISSTSISFTVDVKVLTVSGTTSTNNVRTYITVEPDFA